MSQFWIYIFRLYHCRITDWRNGFVGNSCRVYVSITGVPLDPFINSSRNISKSFFRLILHHNKKHKFTLITPFKIWYIANIIILYAHISYSKSSYCLDYGVRKRLYIFSFGRCEMHISIFKTVLPKYRLRRLWIKDRFGSTTPAVLTNWGCTRYITDRRPLNRTWGRWWSQWDFGSP